MSVEHGFTKKDRVATIITNIALAIVGFVAIETYREVRSMHDAVLTYNLQIADIRVRLAAVETEVVKLKEARKP